MLILLLTFNTDGNNNFGNLTRVCRANEPVARGLQKASEIFVHSRGELRSKIVVKLYRPVFWRVCLTQCLRGRHDSWGGISIACRDVQAWRVLYTENVNAVLFPLLGYRSSPYLLLYWTREATQECRQF